MGNEFPNDLGVWQTVLFSYVQQGRELPEALASADLALASYRSNFEDKTTG